MATEATSRRAARRRPSSAATLYLASLVAMLAVWQVAAWAAGDARLLPPPAAVGLALVKAVLTGELPLNLAATLLRVAAGFTIALLIGTAVGLAIGRSPLLDRLALPWVLLLLNLPALVVIVLAYIWIGMTEAAAVVAVAVNKIPNVAVGIREGARAIDPRLVEMGRAFRLGRTSMLRHVLLPQLYPYIVAAARSGLALVWKIVLVVELLGRSNGVGFEIGVRFQLFDVAGILAYALVFVAVVQLLEWTVITPLERRAFRWRR